MQVTFIGDIHGRNKWFHSQYMPPNSIQLGDLTTDSYATWLVNNDTRPHGWQKQRRFFIDGNHEQFPELILDYRMPYQVTEGLWHIPRGYTSGDVIFIGGGFSIDHARRTPGDDWFPEEQISQRQFDRIMGRATNNVDVVVAHDVPSFVYPHLNIYDIPSPHCLALWHIYNRFQPKLWIAGHHHYNKDVQVGRCKFVIVGEAQKQKIDIPLEEDFFTREYNSADNASLV